TQTPGHRSASAIAFTVERGYSRTRRSAGHRLRSWMFFTGNRPAAIRSRIVVRSAAAALGTVRGVVREGLERRGSEGTGALWTCCIYILYGSGAPSSIDPGAARHPAGG